MKEIQGKSILVRVSDCSSYRESTVHLLFPRSNDKRIFVHVYSLVTIRQTIAHNCSVEQIREKR